VSDYATHRSGAERWESAKSLVLSAAASPAGARS
jgi:hypothetical protein